MDVLKPDLEYIDGICYRINPSQYSIPTTNSCVIYNEDADTDSGITTAPLYQDEDELDFINGIEEVDGGRWKASIHVPSMFFSYIIGSKGATRKRIETETRTKVIVPRQGQTGDIVVSGPDKYCVARARKRIKGIVFVQKSRSQFTHFISIPFNDKKFQQGFVDFKNKVLETCHERGIEESIFQSEDKLHMTLCTLVLCDDVDRTDASRVLQECKQDLVTPLLSERSLVLDMTGVEYMNDDPSEVDVLYGKVTSPRDVDLLQKLSDSIVTYFIDKGITNRQYGCVKLHVTLMNTLFRQGAALDDKDRIRETFDATEILKNFADFHFGQAVINHIDISLRYSSTKSGYYQATASITIP